MSLSRRLWAVTFRTRDYHFASQSCFPPSTSESFVSVFECRSGINSNSSLKTVSLWVQTPVGRLLVHDLSGRTSGVRDVSYEPTLGWTSTVYWSWWGVLRVPTVHTRVFEDINVVIGHKTGGPWWVRDFESERF